MLFICIFFCICFELAVSIHPIQFDNVIGDEVPTFAKNVLELLRRDLFFDSSALLHINNIKYTHHNLSLKRYGTWNDNNKLLHEHRKHYCTLRKESYVCWGDKYKSNLKDLLDFPPAALLQYLPRNSFIYAEGDSNVAEKILNWICESHAVGDNFLTWKLKDVVSNDYFIHYPYANISLLMLSHDENLLHHIDTSTVVFEKLNIYPSAIVIGSYHLNSKLRYEDRLEREKHYAHKYPYSKIIRNEKEMKSNCIVPNCRSGSGLDCFPSIQLQENTLKIVDKLMQP